MWLSSLLDTGRECTGVPQPCVNAGAASRDALGVGLWENDIGATNVTGVRTVQPLNVLSIV